MNQEAILKDLEEKTKENISTVKQFETLTLEKLLWSENNESWCILQCIKHLNLYSDFYIEEFHQVTSKSRHLKVSNDFKVGGWGKLFTTKMLPSANMIKMKTFKDKNPSKKALSKSVLSKFLEQQNEFLIILRNAKKLNLNRNSCKITLPALKMRLGDTFRFYCFHNVRHIQQAKETLEKIVSALN